MFTINCKGHLVVVDKPLIMGIINVTPDSFYKGSRRDDQDEILSFAEKMIQEGADILDIGGQSTRPGSERISEDEESSRTIPAIEAISRRFPDLIISVDSYYSNVAKRAVEAGAAMVNDISAGVMDEMMISTVAALKVPYVCMHMKGKPDSMQAGPKYDNVTIEVLDFLISRTRECIQAGIKDLIIDPGFGFGKSIQHNFTLLRELSSFRIVGFPVLVGISRKSTIYKTLGVSADQALNGSTVLHTLALQNGADILRVHDVREAKEALTLYQHYAGIFQQQV